MEGGDRVQQQLTTGEVLRELRPYYITSYEMKQAVDAVWRKHEFRLNWATCLHVVLAVVAGDNEKISSLTLLASSRGVVLHLPDPADFREIVK